MDSLNNLSAVDINEKSLPDDKDLEIRDLQNKLDDRDLEIQYLRERLHKKNVALFVLCFGALLCSYFGAFVMTFAYNVAFSIGRIFGY